MSIHIDKRSLETEVTEDPSQICSIPCKIEYDGEAEINQYFRSTFSKKDSDITASFRGRGLNGVNMDLPEGYTGVVLKEDKKPFLEDEDRQFKVTHKFKTFTYFNWDCTPSSNDAMKKAMLWPTIASAIHSPVDEQSSQQSSGASK